MLTIILAYHASAQLNRWQVERHNWEFGKVINRQIQFGAIVRDNMPQLFVNCGWYTKGGKRFPKYVKQIYVEAGGSDIDNIAVECSDSKNGIQLLYFGQTRAEDKLLSYYGGPPNDQYKPMVPIGNTQSLLNFWIHESGVGTINYFSADESSQGFGPKHKEAQRYGPFSYDRIIPAQPLLHGKPDKLQCPQKCVLNEVAVAKNAGNNVVGTITLKYTCPVAAWRPC